MVDFPLLSKMYVATPNVYIFTYVSKARFSTTQSSDQDGWSFSESDSIGDRDIDPFTILLIPGAFCVAYALHLI